MPKIKKNKIRVPPSLSAEIGAMVEDFNSTVEFIAEQTSEIPKIKKSVDRLTDEMELIKTDVDVIKTDVGVMKEDIDTLKTDVGVMKEDIDTIKTDVGVMKEDIDTIKLDVNIIKNLMKKKVDIEEFAALEHRVALLESRR